MPRAIIALPTAGFDADVGVCRAVSLPFVWRQEQARFEEAQKKDALDCAHISHHLFSSLFECSSERSPYPLSVL